MPDNLPFRPMVTTTFEMLQEESANLLNPSFRVKFVDRSFHANSTYDLVMLTPVAHWPLISALSGT